LIQEILRTFEIVLVVTKRSSDIDNILPDNVKIINGDVKGALLGDLVFQRKIVLYVSGLNNVDWHRIEGIPCVCHLEDCYAPLLEDFSPVANHDCENCAGSDCRFKEFVSNDPEVVSNSNKLFKLFGFGLWMHYLSLLPTDEDGNIVADIGLIRQFLLGKLGFKDQELGLQTIPKSIDSIGRKYGIKV
jgi:hypothetical protein